MCQDKNNIIPHKTVIFVLPPFSLLACQFLIIIIIISFHFIILIFIHTLLATTDHPPLIYPRKPREIDTVAREIEAFRNILRHFVRHIQIVT